MDAEDPVFEIRRMTGGDLPRVLAIEALSFPNPWQRSTFEGEIQNRDFSFPMLAVEKGSKTVIGYVLYWLIQDEVQINNVAVHPDYRRRRVGERMMRMVLDDARRRGGRYAVLEVRMSNTAARTLYEKTLGFHFLAVRRDYYTNPAEDALVLGLSL